jgi:hypothetical protein
MRNRNRAKQEIESARREHAATLALENTRFRSWPFSYRKLLSRVTAFFALLLLIGGLSLFTYTKLFAGTTATSQSFSMVEQVQDLASLATAEAFVTTVIKEEDNKLFNKEISLNIPGTKRTILLIVPATVLAGVDLKSITEEQITIDEEKKKIRLTLPHAQLLQDPSIQMDKVQTYSEEGLFRGEVKWDEGFDLAAAAKEQITAEAIKLGLLEKAEESAVNVLQQFYANLGYQIQVEVR